MVTANNALDDRILDRILHLACLSMDNPAATRLRTYKRQLPLTAVCQAWRQKASAYLYGTVIAEFQPPMAAVHREESKRRKSVWDGIKFSGTTKTAQPQQQQDPAADGTSSGAWHTNVELVQGMQGVVWPRRLRIQMHTGWPPSYDGFAKALQPSDAWWGEHIECIELADYSELQTVTATAWRFSPQSLGSGRQDRQTLATLVTQLGLLLPNVRAITCISPSWNVSAMNKQLATMLVGRYMEQLDKWNVPVSADKPLQQALSTTLGVTLSSLQIETRVLMQLGLARLRAESLESLHLRQAEPFFAWNAFTSRETADGLMVVFANLRALTIEFEKDNVANETHRIEALNAGGAKNSAMVTMGVSRRALLFPVLHSLTVRKVPYAYTAAWGMFLGTPVAQLSVAGKYGHLRHMDGTLLAQLDFLDVHLYGIAGSGVGSHGRFSAFVRQLLGYASQAKSAWLRHAEEVFPLSVPSEPPGVGWTELRELNIVGYLPPFGLLTLVAQLPRLFRLVVQRVVLDINEPILPDDALAMDPESLGLWDVQAPQVASTSVRELQVHLGGSSQLRRSTLQVLCYLLTAMPCVGKLAIRHGYRVHVLRFILIHAFEFPDLQRIQMVPQVYMHHLPLH